MKNRKELFISILLSIVSIVYIVLLKLVDVSGIGPSGSEVGFSSMNLKFKELVGSNMTIYKITEILGYLVLGIVCIYGIIGLIQLVKRRSLLKVDRDIMVLGIFYVVVLILYLLFDEVAINYRPILIDGELEPSFPSSHTMLALCVCISSLMVSRKYIDKNFITITNFITVLLMIGVLVGRIVSGVHWLSDIIGGVIISITLLSWFYTALVWKKK